MAVIPFYGATRPDLFAIERSAMDRAGLVIGALDDRLPGAGRVLDVGAGDGFTAVRLTTAGRQVVAVEPAPGMAHPDRDLPWVGADAERLPFRDGAFGAAYATWAYFFSRYGDPTPGLRELHRVVEPGGPLLIVENLGGDELCALAPTDISGDPDYWAVRGFDCAAIDTHFEFERVDDARRLLGFWFGEPGERAAALRLTFRVGLFSAVSRGPAAP